MRTTLTLEDDIAENAKQVAQQFHRPFKQIINQALRLGLMQMNKTPQQRKLYKTQPHAMDLKEGYSLDNIQELLSRIEGEATR